MDAKTLFIDLGMMILEGRTPQQSLKGRREGDHYPSLMGRSTHCCVPSDLEVCGCFFVLKDVNLKSHYPSMMSRSTQDLFG